MRLSDLCRLVATVIRDDVDLIPRRRPCAQVGQRLAQNGGLVSGEDQDREGIDLPRLAGVTRAREGGNLRQGA
jgi:hypothetical protein